MHIFGHASAQCGRSIVHHDGCSHLGHNRTSCEMAEQDNLLDALMAGLKRPMSEESDPEGPAEKNTPTPTAKAKKKGTAKAQAMGDTAAPLPTPQPDQLRSNLRFAALSS